MDWKVIVAIALLVMPLTYCEVGRQRLVTQEKIACLEQDGNWGRKDWKSPIGCGFE